MLPGKTYRPEDYVEILWRRKWVAIVPFVIISLGTVIGTQFLPNRYRSEAQVRVVPPQVPENYVQSTVTASLDVLDFRRSARRFRAERGSSASSRS